MKLSEREEFVIGTAAGIKMGGIGPCGVAREPVISVQNANQVCWKFDVMSCDLRNGFDGTYSLSVKTAVGAE